MYILKFNLYKKNITRKHDIKHIFKTYLTHYFIVIHL